MVFATLAAAGLPRRQANPGQVRSGPSSVRSASETAPIDAAVVAALVATTQRPIRPSPDKKTDALADLVARRQIVVVARERTTILTP